VTPQFQGHGVTISVGALNILCAQLTRDLFAIAKFLVSLCTDKINMNQHDKDMKQTAASRHGVNNGLT